VKPLTLLVEDFGLSVKTIRPFDYKRFIRERKDYLYDLYDNEEVEWQLEHTNVLDSIPYVSRFLAAIRPECRRATLHDIDDMLDQGRLVSVTTVSAVDDHDDRMILIIDRTDKDYIVHMPSQPVKHVPRKKLWEAMGGEQNMSEVTGFMLRKVGLRLDQYVIREKPTLSRAYATRLIIDGKVRINDQPSKPGYKLREQDVITIDYDEDDQPEVPDIDLPILYEDADCIVVNKPTGILTHNKGIRYVEATVASFVRSRSKVLEGERPGIVHRLDRATSGVMICAKTPEALSWLQKQFHDRVAQKTYTAIIQGTLTPSSAIIDMPIERNPKAPASFRVGANGKSAQTYYEIIRTSDNEKYSLLELKPKTGRTHQLRVHLAHHHHPIVGDTLYDGEAADRMYLHAHKLTITLPNGQTKTFEAPLPTEFETKMQG
jgi:23S rRNA pseudouridine1911/1915/1917 synthase